MKESDYVLVNYGENHKEIGVTLSYVVWFREKFLPEDTALTTGQHQKILDFFKEHIGFLTLQKNRPVSREEAFKYIKESSVATWEIKE